MKYLLAILILLSAFASNAQTQVGDDIDGEAPQDLAGRSVALSADGKRIAVGAPFHNGSGTDKGQVRIFEENGGIWNQIGASIEGETTGDRSGWSVSLSSDGKRLAIGAILNDGAGISSGHVRVYAESGGTWKQIGEDVDGESTRDRSGFSVALSADGKRFAVGAIYNEGNGYNAGHARIYEDSSGVVWKQVGNDIDAETDGDECGRSVSLSANGKRVAIGAMFNDGNGVTSGHTRIFQETNGSWSQIGSDINGEATRDESGWHVALAADGKRVAIGARYNDVGADLDVGHVRVYQEIGGTWAQIGNDIDGSFAGGTAGVVAMSASGKKLVVGAPFNGETGVSAGKVSVYQEVGGNWIANGSDLFGEGSQDKAGWSVAISADGRRVAYGAINNSDAGMNAGHARVFESPLIPVENIGLNASAIQLVPNPTSGALSLELELLEPVNFHVRLVNVLGEVLMEEQFENIDKLLKTYDLNQIPDGMYWLQIVAGSQSVSKKLVVLKDY